MDRNRFAALSRLMTRGPSRRDVLHGLTGAGLGLGLTRIPDNAEAKKKRKRKKKRKVKTAQPNEFGCLEVGDPCTSADQCCSGICEGKKGQRTCRAHDTGTCAKDRPGYCAVENPELVECKSERGRGGACFRTTAGSNVCVNRFECADCQRDADCEALGYPSGAACAPIVGEFLCAGGCEETGMVCVYLTLEV